jgi:cytochrome P450
MFHKKTIVLNSGKVALDILEARSGIYSDRPKNWMGGEIAGRKRAIFLTPFMDPRFKISRRLLQTGLNTRASKSYRPIQTQETQTLLQNLADDPEDFATHIRR